MVGNIQIQGSCILRSNCHRRDSNIQLDEKERREGSEKVYDERMDMIMEVRARTCS